MDGSSNHRGDDRAALVELNPGLEIAHCSLSLITWTRISAAPALRAASGVV